MNIRRGVESDAAALAELAARTFKETFGADNRPEDMALHVARSYGYAQQLAELADPDVSTLLAELDGRLTGYTQLRVGSTPSCVTGESPVELWRFYVAAAWHGRGVAQRLMNEVEIGARRPGPKTLWLGVWERNDRARAFYAKCGFADVGEHVFLFGTDPQTDRVMTMTL